MTYKKSAIVIGAGIHGVCIADELASNGLDVTIFDMHDDILRDTSKGCHNRAHLGYHYPRSLSTVQDKGLQLILIRYGLMTHQVRLRRLHSMD